jgi:hypothetical protein
VIKSRRKRWVQHVACVRDRRGSYRGLVGKPEGRRPLGSVDWRIILKIGLQEMGWRDMD